MPEAFATSLRAARLGYIAPGAAPGEPWAMNQFSRSLMITIVAAIGATACATAEPYDQFQPPGMRKSYHSLKSGYMNSTRGREVQTTPLADTLVDGSV